MVEATSFEKSAKGRVYKISKSVNDEHSFNSKHLLCFDQTRILASTPYYSSDVISEVLEIEKYPNNFN
jgi:hypothetical protein